MRSNKYHPNRIGKINSKDLYSAGRLRGKATHSISQFQNIKVLTTNYYHTNMFIFNHRMLFLVLPNKINQFVKFEREKKQDNKQARADYFILKCTSYIHGKCQNSKSYINLINVDVHTHTTG